MTDRAQVEYLGEHRYLVRARQGEDVVEIVVYASPVVIARLAAAEIDEARIVEATAAFLFTRQRPDDLPPQLDLEDVAAAYDGFEEDVSQRLGACGIHRGGEPGSGTSA